MKKLVYLDKLRSFNLQTKVINVTACMSDNRPELLMYLIICIHLA